MYIRTGTLIRILGEPLEMYLDRFVYHYGYVVKNLGGRTYVIDIVDESENVIETITANNKLDFNVCNEKVRVRFIEDVKRMRRWTGRTNKRGAVHSLVNPHQDVASRTKSRDF
jgi:hypothetical protein